MSCEKKWVHCAVCCCLLGHPAMYGFACPWGCRFESGLGYILEYHHKNAAYVILRAASFGHAKPSSSLFHSACGLMSSAARQAWGLDRSFYKINSSSHPLKTHNTQNDLLKYACDSLKCKNISRRNPLYYRLMNYDEL